MEITAIIAELDDIARDIPLSVAIETHDEHAAGALLDTHERIAGLARRLATTQPQPEAEEGIIPFPAGLGYAFAESMDPARQAEKH